jgi:nucleoside-diphosphate-sugar epimerase
MNVLILGGTQLSGPSLVRELLRRGCRVVVFHRGNHEQNVPAGVGQIVAPWEPGAPEDRLHLRAFSGEFRRLRPDVVVHMIAFTRADAEAFVSVFRGVAGRAVVVSSSDVYRVMGLINRTEGGPPNELPIDEDGALRTKPSVHGAERDKRFVEEVVLAAGGSLPACVLRYPAVFGPGSSRRYEWVRRMLDGRPAILMGHGEARFRFSHGYAGDVGLAAALAVTEWRPGMSTVYNVGEADVPTERQRLERFARAAGWRGEVAEAPDEQIPAGDCLPWPGAYHWLLETSRVRRELGYAEVHDPDLAIIETIEWQRANPPRERDPKQFDYAAEDHILQNRAG